MRYANKSGKKWNIANKFAYVKKKQYFCTLICVYMRIRVRSEGVSKGVKEKRIIYGI